MQMRHLPLHTSVFCVILNDYRKAVQTAVNITGDSDSVGSVAGGILGAKLGIDVIPMSWTEALNEKKKLEEMVGPLLEKYFRSQEIKGSQGVNVRS